MPRPRKKPNYNPHQIMQEFMDAIADAFGFYDDRDDDTAPGLNAAAAEFGITALKARKLLITAGVYSTALSCQIAKLYSNGAKIEQMMKITELSRASVHSYLPYTKIPYNLAELSANAERIRLYRERKQKCAEFRSKLSALSENEQEAELWNMLTCLQGCAFLTAKGLRFTYKIKGGEMFVNRKSKSITQATVFMAYWKAMELGGVVDGPKKLGIFGASYLYPVFVRIGAIRMSHGGADHERIEFTDFKAVKQKEAGNGSLSDLDGP